MNKFCLSFLILLFAVNLFAKDDDDKLKLAVMEFEDSSGRISSDLLASATEYIRIVFASTNRYFIISKDRQKETIRDIRKKYNTDPTYRSCTDKNCQIQLGQALSADMIVKTTLSYFAGYYTVSSELIDLEKEATIIGAKEDFNGSEEELKLAIDKIVEKIAGVEIGTKDEVAVHEEKQPKFSSSKDSIACEYARSESDDFGWRVYLEKYPKGECAAEAREKLDKSACRKAEKRNSAASWKEYLTEFPDGECEFKARTTLQKLKAKEKKEAEAREKAAIQQENFYSPADERMDNTFTGRYNFGILANFDYYDKFGLSTGFDFDFNVFSKPDGGGAGNLFVGLGFDLRFYLPIKSDNYIFMEIPILANFGYDFKVNTYALRYVGFWFSPGFNLITVFYDDDGSIEKAFAWEAGFEMIFRSRFTVNLGFGGNVVNYWDSSHFFFNIGTIF
ncbi:hypothetical protein II898_08580 [bacterium]|nr:hypothetical protein [bacterium]